MNNITHVVVFPATHTTSELVAVTKSVEVTDSMNIVSHKIAVGKNFGKMFNTFDLVTWCMLAVSLIVVSLLVTRLQFNVRCVGSISESCWRLFRVLLSD